MARKNTIAREATISADFKAQFADGMRKALKKRGLSQSELARRMATSRAVVHRLLKGDDTAITLQTMAKAAAAVGHILNIRFV